MLARIRLRPTYANVVATLALFVALGGGAYAAVTLPANSVGTKQIKKNAVTGLKVKNNSLTGADIQEATLAKVPSARHADSSAALDKVTYKTAAGTALHTAPFFGSATAVCDAGQHVVGGGVKVNDLNNGLVLDEFPDVANTAWTARVGNGSSTLDVSFTVYAVCTSVTTTG